MKLRTAYLLATVLSVGMFTHSARAHSCTNVNCGMVRGHVEAIRSVAILPQVEGYVSEVCFSEGSMVKKGSLLYRLETERFQYQVDLATAELSVATTTVVHAKREYDRMMSADSRGISQVEMEAACLQYETAKSTESQAKANLALATFDLMKTRVLAPIDGRIGASTAWPGSYVSPIHTPLAQIVQLDPIRVVFPIPASEYVRLKRDKISLGQVCQNVRIVLSDGNLYNHVGCVDFENNVINEDDGMIYIGASFSNPDQLLLPNAVVDVLVEVKSAE